MVSSLHPIQLPLIYTWKSQPLKRHEDNSINLPFATRLPAIYNFAPTILAQCSVLNDLGRSIGAPTARSIIS